MCNGLGKHINFMTVVDSSTFSMLKKEYCVTVKLELRSFSWRAIKSAGESIVG